MAIEVTVEPVRVAVLSLERTVILQQKGTDNYLPFWVDEFQGDVITAQLQGWPNKDVELDRFLANNNAAHASVKRTIIHLEDDAFCTKVLLSQHDGEYEAKCPIGIALALACKANAPILVNEEGFNKVGVRCTPTLYKPLWKESWWRRAYKRWVIPNTASPAKSTVRTIVPACEDRDTLQRCLFYA